MDFPTDLLTEVMQELIDRSRVRKQARGEMPIISRAEAETFAIIFQSNICVLMEFQIEFVQRRRQEIFLRKAIFTKAIPKNASVRLRKMQEEYLVTDPAQQREDLIDTLCVDDYLSQPLAARVVDWVMASYPVENCS